MASWFQLPSSPGVTNGGPLSANPLPRGGLLRAEPSCPRTISSSLHGRFGRGAGRGRVLTHDNGRVGSPVRASADAATGGTL